MVLNRIYIFEVGGVWHRSNHELGRTGRRYTIKSMAFRIYAQGHDNHVSMYFEEDVPQRRILRLAVRIITLRFFGVQECIAK